MDPNDPTNTEEQETTEEKEITDLFTRFRKDPRLDTLVYQLNNQKKPDGPHPSLTKQLATIKDDEEFFEELRRLKAREHRKLADTLESAPITNRQEILRRLSNIADSILFATCERVSLRLEQKYGIPMFLSAIKQPEPASLAMVAMGKLGSQEINYCSDLDIIFVYSHRGETTGKPEPIDNGQYFVQLVQRLIGMLSVLTPSGSCFTINTAPKSLGSNAGALVTSYDHFIDHQMNKAMPWERQALLEARAMTQNPEFKNLLQTQIDRLAYSRPLPDSFTKYMHEVRQRIIAERAKQTTNGFDIKWGAGGLMDIEFILHHIALKYSPLYPELRQRSLFVLLDILKNHPIIPANDLHQFAQAHLCYRTIESLLHLDKKRAESFLEWSSESAALIGEILGVGTSSQLQGFLQDMKAVVQKWYGRFYLTDRQMT